MPLQQLLEVNDTSDGGTIALPCSIGSSCIDRLEVGVITSTRASSAIPHTCIDGCRTDFTSSSMNPLSAPANLPVFISF